MSRDDDFAAELSKEVDAQVEHLYARVHGCSRNEEAVVPEDAGGAHYDPVYYDSDDQEDAPRPKLTDEQLMYDASMDGADEKWMETERNRHLPPDLRARLADQTPNAAAKARNRSSGLLPLPTSDAILNCPACMTTLCLDCQRHETYANQFRAMFVMNMAVNHAEVFEFKEPKKSKPRWRDKKRSKGSSAAAGEMDEEQQEQDGARPTPTTEATLPEDEFHPAHCLECNTLVAMYDVDEVYHFFNVIDSEA